MKKKATKKESAAHDQKLVANRVLAFTISASAKTKSFDHFILGNITDDLPPLETVKAERPLREALGKMCTKKYSQLPVIQGKTCIGAVTLESILTLLTQMDAKGDSLDFMDWPVRRFVDRSAKSIQAEEDLLKNAEMIADKGFNIIGSNRCCESLVASYDLVLFFKEQTEIFLLLREIETCLRFLVRDSLSRKGLKKALHSIQRRDGRTPSDIDDLTFDELRGLICHNWRQLKDCFLEKERIDRQLVRIRDLRNGVFHFQGQITKNDFAFIKRIRDNCIRLANSKTGKPYPAT